MVNHATKNEKAKITVTPCFDGTINPAMIDVNEKITVYVCLACGHHKK